MLVTALRAGRNNVFLLSHRAVTSVASRAADFGDSVWNEFTPLAVEHGAINLSQGLPTIPVEGFALESLAGAARAGMHHQYTRPAGHPALVGPLARHAAERMALCREVDPLGEVLVTVGATQALFLFFQTFVEQGDEVIIIEPFYDSYAPQVEMAGGACKFVPLRLQHGGDQVDRAETLETGGRERWGLDLDELRHAFSPRTKAIVVNSPHNPTGHVFSGAELRAVATLCVEHDALCLSDNVYDQLLYPGAGGEEGYVAMAALPDMWGRTVTLGSIGKTFGVTGWKIDWAVGAEPLLRSMALTQQYIPFCVATPLQEALADMLERAAAEQFFERQTADFLRKRDRLFELLCTAGLDPVLPEASYFILARTSGVALPSELISTAPRRRDYDFARWLTTDIGVACIPPSAFTTPKHAHLFGGFARFCFCKLDDDIEEAGRRLLAVRDFCAPSR